MNNQYDCESYNINFEKKEEEVQLRMRHGGNNIDNNAHLLIAKFVTQS